MEQTQIALTDLDSMLTEETLDKIMNVDVLKKTVYSNMNVLESIRFFIEKYVKQLSDFIDINQDTVIADIGSGIGISTFALRLATNAKIISIEPNEELVEGAKEIAGYLGIADGIEWRVEELGQLEMKDREADVVFCIEVLEHVFGEKEALRDLRRVADKIIVLSTPNLWFPVVAHDTQLPFCHWLPVPLRKQYAHLFGRQKREYRNIFWSPMALRKHLKPFKRVSKWFHYKDYGQYLNTFPIYYPYRGGFYVERLHPVKKIYYDITSKLGKHSYMVNPSLAGVYMRNGDE